MSLCSLKLILKSRPGVLTYSYKWVCEAYLAASLELSRVPFTYDNDPINTQKPSMNTPKTINYPCITWPTSRSNLNM